ncbi:Cutinase transcription factor 1 alpha [Tolypocladium paradoxum]|uniref:Cutinase transcription factor 1 alpha n=1 Tax=Tolypocladium paradoxum TaxID=94208 RepID=A0A2S4KX89_9HYPO|nr:Cutinase transcription factor 1 alpha [Tolypocladium paradoxum]
MLRPTASPVRAQLRRPLLVPAAALPSCSVGCLSRAPSSRFSTQSRLLGSQKKAPPKAETKESAAESPSFETSFASLGLSRNMKIFLVVVVSIFGTMETWFYCKAAWIWWKGGETQAAEKR